MAATTVDSPLAKVVGEKTAKALRTHLDLHTAGDLIYHFPRRYDERGQHTDIRALVVGEQATVLGQVLRVGVRPMRARRGQLLEVTVGDGAGGVLDLTFFNQAWRERDLRPGRWGLFAGKVTEFRGKRQLNGPDYVLLDEEARDQAEIEEFAGALIPVYPAAAGVPTWVIARCVRVCLEHFQPPPDPLPPAVRTNRGLVDLGNALRQVHRPDSRELLAAARRRLAWDEAFAVQVTLVQRKHRAADWPAKPRPRRGGGLLEAFDAALPYQLTAGQLAVGEQLAADLASPHPMHRLLQGEVGSGKTVCALRAMLQVVDAGGQAAMLAPTEVLATQHLRSLTELLGPLATTGEPDLFDQPAGSSGATQVALVTGSMPAAARRTTVAQIRSGAAGIVVGTHALLYETVEFADLGLVIVDEQHRFGVEQRDTLRAKAGSPPHTLVMTATPIPRTVAMTVYGDLEISTLTELPQGRTAIASHVVLAAEKPAHLDRAWRRVIEEINAGYQAYVVCPRIGEAGLDEDLEPVEDVDRRPPLAVADVAGQLAAGPLAGVRLGILHGRLAAAEKDAVMRSFAEGELDVLVATTVVEVGVDVANATMMVVLDADRFGVSQLHQLRGRVGRGTAPGLCLLVTDAPAGTPARERLAAVAATVDGFELAELDLAQRREGDVLGAVQSGRRSHLRMLSLLRDRDLIGQARQEAIGLIEADPELDRHPLLREMISGLVDQERAEFLEKG